MTTDDIKILQRQRFGNFSAMNKTLWTKAFTEYNEDHPIDRPLTLHCRSCYMKVYDYIKVKYQYNDATEKLLWMWGEI